MGLLQNINSPKDIKNLSTDELNLLAGEIRQFLIENVSKTGGHLASNLGICEITLAIHKVFDSPNDSIVFDVGHQSYVHKIITGRRDLFPTLRKFNGLSGFPKSIESPHDVFNSGHSSNSVSVALGIAEANKLSGNKNFAIALLGDGALTGGLVYEALNNAGRSDSNLIVILNDNEMSISQNVGGMTKYLNKLRTAEKYTDFKSNLKSVLNQTPVGKKLSGFLSTTKSGLKHMLLSDTIFDSLGFTHIGPIDGHDISALISVLESAKHLKKPVFIHAYTKKGKGYEFAEKAPHLYHGVGPFDKTKPIYENDALTYSKIAGNAILNAAETDKKIVAISAAMCDSTGLSPFSKKFPERFFDVGISEGHAVTFSAGLSKKGYFPVACIYSTFLQRAYDNILHDLSLQQLPALLCIDRAGLVGEDGETHHGIFDISFLSHIPEITIFTPYSKEGVEGCINYALTHKDKLYAVRYPRGKAVQGNIVSDPFVPELLREGEKYTVVSISAMTEVVKQAEFDGDHFHLNCIKPLDVTKIAKSLSKTKKLVTVEDNIENGGMGELLTSQLSKKYPNLKFSHTSLAVKDRYVPQGSVGELLSLLGMDKKAIEELLK